ncbi:MAG: hypothetical protein QGH62_07425 [Nitrospinaceae bacterium]|nr:hypothetical protein [Nitrospinaceae bacterium]
MSDIHYENRQLALWAEYDDLNGRVSFEAFMERHVNVNAYIVNLMKSHGRLPAEMDRSESAKRFAEMDLVQMGD